MSTYEKMLEIATEAHKNQKRWDGSPYINHPIAVSKCFSRQHENDLCIIALGHDLFEDTDITIEDLKNAGFSDNIINGINILTKQPTQKYLDYILYCRSNYYTREVKKADLKHNLSDLDGKRNKSMKDKYELAYYILESYEI